MTGPINAVVGDLDEPTRLPETQIDEQVLNEEKKLAKYSKTVEFQRLRDFMEARISFYQTYLPDGRDVGTGQPSVEDWRVANRIIAEFRGILDEYDQAREAVDENG